MHASKQQDARASAAAKAEATVRNASPQQRHTNSNASGTTHRRTPLPKADASPFPAHPSIIIIHIRYNIASTHPPWAAPP